MQGARIGRMPWSQSGWIPRLSVISWPALERRREEHEAAVAALAKARTAKARHEATLALPDATEAAVRSLFATIDSEGPDGWKADYNSKKASVDAVAADLVTVPVGGPALDAWCQQAQASGETDLVEAARLRLRVRVDAETIAAMRDSVLGRDQYLRNGAILRRVECEVAACREALTAPDPEPKAAA